MHMHAVSLRVPSTRLVPTSAHVPSMPSAELVSARVPVRIADMPSGAHVLTCRARRRAESGAHNVPSLRAVRPSSSLVCRAERRERACSCELMREP